MPGFAGLSLTFSVNGYDITPKDLENKLHKYFDNIGKRLRIDKDREWFYDITVEDQYLKQNLLISKL